MQESNALPKPVFSSPLWLRIFITCLFFTDAALRMWSHFYNFAWVPWFCFGLYYLISVPLQKGEVRGAYFKKPRSIAALALLTVAIAGFGRILYSLFAR
jgi:hypothetical protein